MSGDLFTSQQDNAPAHRTRDSCIAFSWSTRLHEYSWLAVTKQPPVTAPQCGWLRGLRHFARERVYRCQIRDVSHLKERLIEEWRHFDHSIIDRAVNQWRQRLRRCIREKGGHFDHQISTIRLFKMIAAVLVNRIFGFFYLYFYFWVMQSYIF